MAIEARVEGEWCPVVTQDFHTRGQSDQELLYDTLIYAHVLVEHPVLGPVYVNGAACPWRLTGDAQ